MSWVVVHYQEIGIKGRNRASFERALMRHLADGIANCLSGKAS